MKLVVAKWRGASWDGGAVYTNPTAGTVLAESLARSLPAGEIVEHEYVLVVSSDVSTQVEIQHRDNQNVSNLEAFRLIVPATVTAFPVFVGLRLNERVRVVAAQNVTGNVSAVLMGVALYD
jgi:hypothetical protein